MREKAALLAAATLLLAASAGVARAGAILNQQQTITTGNGKTHSVSQTLMVQGRKQKMTSGTETVITDLDEGKMWVIRPARRSYLEVPFPPKRGTGFRRLPLSDLRLEKTGVRHEVAGYSCDEYHGAGKSPMAEYSVTGCFSTSAPGAGDFTAFNQEMLKRLGGNSAGGLPAGVPLTLDSSTQMTRVSIPGLTPEQAEKEMIAKRLSLVTNVQVTKITAADLSADTFAVPAGYTREKVPTRAPVAPSPPTAASPPAGTKVPE